MTYRVEILPVPYRALRTDCDGCGHVYTLRTTDADGILIGDECPKCEYYTTRYQTGMEPK